MLTKTKLILIFIILVGLIIRLWDIYSTPSLNPDEAALLYNTKSLLQTGKDEHGHSWPLHFESFGDYKPGGYVYLSLPFVYLLGSTEFAIRLPNLIFSILSIYAIYVLVNLLTNNLKLALTSAFLLATSPWHIHFSRGAWESCTATSLTLFGIVFYLKYFKLKATKPYYLYLSTLFFALTLSVYHSSRIVTPFLMLTLLFAYPIKIIGNLKTIFFSLLIFFCIALPVGISFIHNGGTKRFGGVGITADPGPLWRANELLNDHGNTKLLNRAIHNQRILYFLSWAEKYTSHYNLNFLFLNGDEVPRSKSPDMGQSYIVLLPFFVLGLFSLTKQTKKAAVFIILFMCISPLASSLTFQAPSALRALTMSIPLQIIISLGFFEVYNLLTNKQRIVFICIFGITFTWSLFNYLNSYFIRYPKELPFAWEYGFKELGTYLITNQSKYSRIYITQNYDQPYIMIALYTNTNPLVLQSEGKLTTPDKYGFSTIPSFGKYIFSLPEKPDSNSLYITGYQDAQPTGYQLIDHINFPNQSPGFTIYKTP